MVFSRAFQPIRKMASALVSIPFSTGVRNRYVDFHNGNLWKLCFSRCASANRIIEAYLIVVCLCQGAQSVYVFICASCYRSSFVRLALGERSSNFSSRGVFQLGR